MFRKTTLWEALHLAFLSLCVGAIVMVGATAAVAFPTARKLNLKLGGMEAYTGDHWVMAAGGIMAPVFRISGYVQYVCIVMAFLTFALACWPRNDARRSKLVLARTVVLMALAGVSAYQAITLRPRMDKNLDAIWMHARASDNSGAAAAKVAFDADHGPSRVVLEATLGLTFLGVALACCSAARTGAPREIPA